MRPRPAWVPIRIMKTIALLLLAGCALTPAELLSTPPPDAAPIEAPLPARLEVTRVAHASVLLSLGGATVLTDPWFSETAGYHHGEPLSVGVGGLPKLDAVVVSHGHYD